MSRVSRPIAAAGASAELRAAVCAARAVGWRGEVRGLVEFGAVRFYPVLGAPVRFGPPGAAWLTGCVVVCTDPYVGLHEASLLAGYSRRLVTVHTPPADRPTANATPPRPDAKAGRRRRVFDAVDVQLQAALLDEGVVHQDDTRPRLGSGVAAAAGCRCAVLSWPGDVVAPPLQRDDRWRRDRRWRAFYNTVAAAPAQRRMHDTSDAGRRSS